MKRRYWAYFLDTLRYPEIQHHGSLALLAEAEGGELERLYESAQKMRDQFFPGLAEKEAVIIHGQARGVPRHFLESDDQYRTRVLKAWPWQNMAGRHWGLHKIFTEYGFPVIRLTNLSGDDHWAEFDLDVESPPGAAVDELTWDLVLWIVFEYKRASAMLRTMRLVKVCRGRVVIKMAPVIGELITLYPAPSKPAETRATLYSGGLSITHERWRLGCSYCGHLPPVFKTPLPINRTIVTHEYWQLGD